MLLARSGLRTLDRPGVAGERRNVELRICESAGLPTLGDLPKFGALGAFVEGVWTEGDDREVVGLRTLERVDVFGAGEVCAAGSDGLG